MSSAARPTVKRGPDLFLNYILVALLRMREVALNLERKIGEAEGNTPTQSITKEGATGWEAKRHG